MAAFQYKKVEDVIRAVDSIPHQLVYDEDTGFEYDPNAVVSTGLDRTNTPTPIQRADQYEVNELLDLVERSTKDLDVDYKLRSKTDGEFSFLRQIVVDRGARP